MKLITLNVPEKYLDALEDLIKAGYYPNRAEAIRTAVGDLIISERVLLIYPTQNTSEIGV